MNFLSTLSDRERKVLGLAFFIVLAFVVDRFVFQTMQNQSIRMESEVRAKKAHVLKNEAMLTRQGTINAQWDAVSRFIPPQSTPVSRDESDFMTLILKHAERSRIGLKNIKPMPQVDSETHAEYIFEVEITASMNDFLQFLYAVENAHKMDASPGFVNIRECEIKPSDEDPEQLKITLLLAKLVSLT